MSRDEKSLFHKVIISSLPFYTKAKAEYVEQRRDVRYDLKAPASLSIEKSSSFACMIFMHDISSGGALISSTTSIPKSDKVTLRTKLPFQQSWFGRNEVEFVFRGVVVRETIEKGQYAIQFDDDYRISTSLSD